MVTEIKVKANMYFYGKYNIFLFAYLRGVVRIDVFFNIYTPGMVLNNQIYLT